MWIRRREYNVNQKPSYLKPALIGGLVTGFLSWVPIISAGNCLCCMWVIVGGVLAAYFLSEQQQRRISSGDGALAGLLSGVFGALIEGLLHLISFPIFGMRMLMSQIERARSMPGMSPEVQRFLENIEAGHIGGIIALIAILAFLAGVIIFAIFGTLGGLLGAAMFGQKQQRLQPPPAVPPAPPTGQ